MACDEAWNRHFHPAVRHTHRHRHPEAHHTHTHPDGFTGEHAHAHDHEAVAHAHAETHAAHELPPHEHTASRAGAQTAGPVSAGGR